MNRVIIIATSTKARGGISTVVRSYTLTPFWNEWGCYWLETHIDRSRFLKTYYFLKSLVHFIFIVHKFQIVHIHLSEPASALRKYFFLKISKLFSKPVIAHFHSFSTQTTIDGNSQNLYYKIFQSSDRILVLSSSWKNWIIQKWPQLSDKIEVLYNPCPAITVDKTLIKSNTIIYAGTLIDRKGYSDLINGFALIAKKYSGWNLCLAGNGEIEKGKQLVRELNIENRVDFKGWISGEDKDHLFRSALIFCLPSYAEGFPMAVLDAWAYGLPVITTLVGGLPDIVIDGKNALVIQPGDIKGISEAIERLISDEILRSELSQESLELSRTIFSLDQITRELGKIYTSLLIKAKS